MADREPYSTPDEMLPRGTDSHFGRSMQVLPAPAGWASAAGLAVVGFSVAARIIMTSPSTLVMMPAPIRAIMSLVSLYLLASSTASFADGGRMTHLGLLATMLTQIVSSCSLALCLAPTIATASANGEWVALFIVSLFVLLPCTVAPVSVRRMRETLWQDASRSAADSTVLLLRVNVAAWLLSHVGNPMADRFAIVETPTRDGKTVHFVLDKMEGRLACVEDPDVAAASLERRGYAIERIADDGGVMRRRSYPAAKWERAVFLPAPQIDVTTAEYYHRYI